MRPWLYDRENLLREIAGLVTGSVVQTPTDAERLNQWHQEGERRFLQLLALHQVPWPVSLAKNRYQLSYLINRESGEVIPSNQLVPVLEQINNAVRSTVWTGWSMFYPFKTSEIAPSIHPEFEDGTGLDILEGNLMHDDNSDLSLPDFWRVAGDGRVTLTRAYREDRARSVVELKRAAGSWVSPETFIRETAELITHARHMTHHFSTATKVSFRCTWMGLQGREIMEFVPSATWSLHHTAKADQRTIEGEWSPAQLSAIWSTVVAELACPILALFQFPYCSPDFVAGMAPKFIKL